MDKGFTKPLPLDVANPLASPRSRAYLCLMTHTETARWSKSHPSWGSARRVQRNAYAYAVTMAMTQGRMVCPACDDTLNLETAEVDRCIPALDYREGNIVYVCRACNQGRAVLQSQGSDWTHAEAYAEAVREASATVTVPSIVQARDWWNNRPTVAHKASRWA